MKQMYMKRVMHKFASTFYCIRCQKEIDDHANDPAVADALKKSFYGDEFLGVANTNAEVLKVIDRIMYFLFRVCAQELDF